MKELSNWKVSRFGPLRIWMFHRLPDDGPWIIYFLKGFDSKGEPVFGPSDHKK